MGVFQTWILALSRFLRGEPLPQRPLVVVALALVGGCAAGPLLANANPDACISGWVGATVAITLWGVLVRCGRPRAAAWLLVAAVTLAGASWAVARMDVFSAHELAWHLDEHPRPIAIRGTIVESPRLLPPLVGDEGRAAAIGPSSQCVVDVTAARWGESWDHAAGMARVLVAGEPVDLPVGTEVSVFGRGLRPAEPLNPGEPDLAQRARESRQLAIVRVNGWESVQKTSSAAWWWPATAVDMLRRRAAEILENNISPERADLAAALLVGQRNGLSRELTDNFLVTGTIHVLSISGLHVAFLAAGLVSTLGALGVPRYRSGMIVAAFIGGYMMLVGAGTPVVRATILVWVACGALAIGRRPATINSLALAAMVVCAWRPAEVFSVGAQLSFLSTGVLVGVATLLHRPRDDDPIARLIERSRSRWEKLARRAGTWTSSAFLASAAVWLATTPVVAAWFHVVSFIGLIVNVVVAAIVPVAMACGFLCLLSAPLSGSLAWVFGTACDASLALMQTVVSGAAAVPGSHVWVAGPPGWWVAGWYVIFVVALAVLRRELLRRATTWITLAAVWSSVGILADAISSRPGGPGLRVTMAAVGHGCGVVVTSPLGRCLVYDAGRLGAPSAARRTMEAVLWSEGIARIDTLVISHGDSDHFNAVPALLERFPVGEVLVPEALLGSRSPSIVELIAEVRARGIPIRTAKAGDGFAIDPLCRARVLHPWRDAEPAFQADNETSLVLSIESAGRRVLLTGDLEGQALASFNESDPGQCDVLIAPHHGSRTSLPATIATVTKPQLVLVSGRGGRHWREVQAAYSSAAATSPEAVLHTGREGAIAVCLTASDIRVDRFAAGRWQTVPCNVVHADDTDGFIIRAPTPSNMSWLATYAPRAMRAPLVKP